GGSFGTANSLARSDHNHDAAYVNVTGDAMTGPLTATRLAAGGCPTALDGDACAAGNLDVAGGLTAAAATVTGNVQVDGDIGLDGAVVQQRTVGGTVKAAVLVTCSTTPSILQSFVNVRGVGGTITATTGGSTGRCKLNFPFQVDDRYIVATPAGTNGAVGVTWNTLVEDSDTISFSRFATTSGSGVNGAISVLVY